MAATSHELTRELAERSRGLCFDELPDEVVEVARHCLLDWLGVTVAGAGEPLAAILRDTVQSDATEGAATLLGPPTGRAGSLGAALINGATGHALDFDDTHWTMNGHPSVPVMPAALALAEELDLDGRRLLEAIVAGIELECGLGALIGRRHYAAGFHATGTLGTLGAAAACAKLLDLGEQAWLHALGLAGTQAAGLKSSFGTMAKPLHAGKAAHDGLLAARLAAGGFTGNTRVVESRQGLADTLQGGEPEAGALRADKGRFYILDTLFKYHAACYLTQSGIEAAHQLRRNEALVADDIVAVEIRVPPSSLDVCNIEQPTTGLEGKFSLRATAALALLGAETQALSTWSDERMGLPDLVGLRDRITVVPEAGIDPMATPVAVATADHRRLEARVDVGRPATDLAQQRSKLEAKFRALVVPVLGEEAAAATIAMVAGLHEIDSASALTRTLAAASRS
jgi:2-methylcitrate dehydratase PrpD